METRMEPKTIAEVIRREDALAEQKSARIQGQPGALFFGSAGSGKTTVLKWGLGVDYKCSNLKLEGSHEIEGFEESDRLADVTRGLSFAEIAGVFCVDSCGQQATGGPLVEIQGAICRSSVIERARSIRAVLVLKDAKLDVGVSRGGSAIRDFEHVASLFPDIEAHLGSIGLILTSKPRNLGPGSTAHALRETRDALESLVNVAVEHDHGLDEWHLAEGHQISDMAAGHQISENGLKLLRHFRQQCDLACTLAERIPEDDDLSLVEQLVQQRLSVFPVNVTDAQQRTAFHDWIRCLQPVEQPRHAMEYTLPAECSTHMESLLGRWSYGISQSIASQRYKWVLNNELVQQVIDHLDLSGILARDLLPRAQLIRKDVCDRLVRQNESCVETLKEGLCRGQLGELETALDVLSGMDAFRKSCGATVNGQLSGWLSKAAALQRCIEAAEKALNDQLPNKSWSRPFLSHQALEVGSIFAGLKMLEDPRAVKLVESWAQIFWEHLTQLNERASECSSPERTVRALRELLAAQEYLSQPVLPRLSEHHPSLRDFDFQVFVTQTKEQVVKQLADLSKKVVEKRRQSPSEAPETWQKLQELCKSTELNELLEKDLEQCFLKQPLFKAFMPEQTEIDGLKARITNGSSPEDFGPDLLVLARSLESCGDFAAQLAKELSFDELSVVLKKQVKEIKEGALKALQQLTPRISGRRLPSSGASADSTTDDDLPNMEDSEAVNIKGALDQLKMLLPFDTLLIQLGDVVCVSATTFSLGNCLERKFRSSLDAAERERGRKKWGSGTLVSKFGTIQLLQVLQDLAGHMSQVLESTDLVQELTKLQEASSNFVQRSVAQELEDWKHASTETKSWLADFAQYVRNAKKFDHLLYRIDGVEEAREELLRKIESFHKNVLETAGIAAEQKDWPQLVKSLRHGLAFEESELFQLLPQRFRKSKDFRELAETQVDACCKMVRAAGTEDFRSQWQRLNLFIEYLPCKDFEKAERLGKVRQELDSAFNDAESKFEKALAGDDLSSAVRLLAQVQNPERHYDRLSQEISFVVKQLDIIGEVEDVCPAAKKLRTLARVDTRAIPNQQMASLVEREWKAVQGKLKSLEKEAASNLQKALGGAGPPNHALHIYAALSGKSKVAAGRDAMEKFAASKKSEFVSMNLEQLMQWIQLHNHIWTSKDMPEELTKTSHSDLLQAFMQNFEKSFKAKCEEMQAMQNASEWQNAKARCEDLRDALQMAEKLELLKPFSSQLTNLKSRELPRSTNRPRAQAQGSDGEFDFRQAVIALVASQGETEQQLYDEIEVAVSENMNLWACDAPMMQKRLAVLDRFMNAAGKSPPYQLRPLVKQVESLVLEHRAKFDEKLDHAVEAVLSATSSTERDLKSLAEALQLNQDYLRLASEDRRQEVREGLHAFRKAILEAVEKVGEDVRKSDRANLQVHLEPMKRYLKVFTALSDEHQKVLSQELGFGQGLLKWMQEILSPYCTEALSAEALLPLFETDLAELSNRFKIAEMLWHVLGTMGLNFKAVQEYISKHILQQKDAADRHLRSNDFEGFNDTLKQVNSLALAFPQHKLSVHVQELETKFKKEVLDGRRQAITSAQSVKDAADGCEALRNLADQARDTYDLVRSSLETALNQLERTKMFQKGGMLLLEQQLNSTPTGKVILAEHPRVFGAVKDAVNNEIFCSRAGMLDSGEVVERLRTESKLNEQEAWELLRALQQHDQSFAELAKKYLLGGKTLEQVKEEAKNDLREAVRACGTNTCSSVQKVLTHLAACYMLVKSGKTFLEATPSEQAQLFEKLTRPHCVQMLVLFRFLQAHKERQVGYFDPLWRWIFGPANSRMAENHLAEVKTGEGKCLLLNMTAAFFALRGRLKVDIVCYQKALMEQDKSAMLEFNEFLEVDQMIRHVTLDDLCMERLDPIVKHSKALLTDELPTARQWCVKERVLLIDEVDMLFTKRFYGRPWTGGFTLKSPAAKELVRYIFEARSSGKEIPNITSTPVFQKLLAEQPEQIHRALALAAGCLVKNWENWNEPMPELNQEKTHIGYSGDVDIDWSKSYPNKSVFAYLQFAKDGDITPEVAETKIGVDLIAGVFSFADLPLSYKYILGVTGTLRELRKIPGLEETLKGYDFRHFTIAPSIFGLTKLNFRHASDVRLCDNESDWIAEIQSRIKSCTDQGQSVLVFFKNQRELQKFPKWKKYELITKSTDPKRISGYVAAATNKGQVTLLTKTHGRGLDFQMKQSTVVVLQTFLSSSESDQTQIQGRTARKGEYGEYQLILCSDHLQAKMNFGDDDLKLLRSGGDGDQIRILLEQKQQEKTLLKVEKMREHRNIASRQEDRTKQWEELLFGNAEREEKLSRLAAWNEENCTLHYTLLVDNSGSMQPSWSQLSKAVQGFKNELAQNSRVANSTKVSVILFNSSAHVVQSTHRAVADMPDMKLETCCGGTSFSAAFSKCHQVMCQSPPESNEFILFFTDGESNDTRKVPVSEINTLMTDHASRISGLTCIAFGREAGKNTLSQIGSIFKTHKPKIDFKLQEACSQESLIRCFADAATSGAMHSR